MLRLRTLLTLNSATSGVLYHYTNSMQSVESIVENGLKTSIYPAPEGEEPLVGVSLSRTKTTIPYSTNDTHTHGYAFDEEGSEYKRWVYGVIFSRAMLAQVGKIRPYDWMQDMNWRKELNVSKVNTEIQELPENWLPDKITLVIAAIRQKDGDCEVKGKVTFNYPAGSVGGDDYYTDEESYVVEDKSYLPKLPKGSPREEFDNLVAQLEQLNMEKNVPIDNASITVIQFTEDLNPSDIESQPALIKKIAADAMQVINRRIQRRRAHQKTSKAGGVVKVWYSQGEPVYLPDEGDTSYDTISKVFQELAETSPRLKLRGDYDHGWQLYGYFRQKSSTELPITMQKILSKVGLGSDFESEERLLVTGAKPGDYLPATKKAIIGIIVPRSQYYSKEIDEFREKHPGIPIYVYAEKEESPDSKVKAIPKEAYRNPVA